MEKKDFENLCRQKRDLTDYGLSASIIPATADYIRRSNKAKLPIIWLETNDSGDNNIAFMNTTYPYLNQVFTEIIDLLYSNSFMAAQGKDALDI